MDFPIHFSQGPCVAWFLPQPRAQKRTNGLVAAKTAAQASGGELHRRILTEFNVTYGRNPKVKTVEWKRPKASRLRGTAESFPLGSFLQNINNCDDDVRKPDRGREASKDFYMLFGLTHWNSYLWHHFGVV